MEDKVPSTLLCNATLVGRLYGQDASYVCMFDVVEDAMGDPVIKVRVRHPWQREFMAAAGTHLLVQLFEQPDVLWLAHATVINEEPMIVYAPMEPLESADGRTEAPALAEVTPEQHKEGVDDREELDAQFRKAIDRHYALPGG